MIDLFEGIFSFIGILLIEAMADASERRRLAIFVGLS